MNARTNADRTTDRPASAHRASTALWTLAVPGALLALTGGVVLTWRDELPDPVASHWGMDGVDGFASLFAVVLWTAGGTAVLALVMWFIGSRRGQAAMTRRFANGFAVGLTTFLCGVLLGTLAPQRGLADPAQVGSIDAGLALSFAVATAAGALVAWLTPGDAPRPSAALIPPSAATLHLDPGESAAWVRSAGQRGGVGIAVGVVAFCALVGAISGQWVFVAALAAALGALLLVLLTWTVTVDRTGLTARAGIRRLRVHVPLDEVELAEVVRVKALREFGGWGLRTGLDGRTGLVLRSGEALLVHRSGDRTLVVTVDDAATGAALLNTLAARTR